MEQPGTRWPASGGAALAAVEKVAKQIESGEIVTILPDSGERYLSDSFWDELA